MTERTSYKASVQCLVYDDNGSFLLIKRINTSYCNNMYALPGGHLEKGESVIDGMIRELEEEIGVNFTCDELKLIKIITRTIGNSNYLDFIFKTSLKGRKVINKEKDLCSRMIFRTMDKIPKGSIPIIKKIIENDDYFITMEE